jgi:hypothetical protein
VCRPSPRPLAVAAMSAVVEELQEQLLAQEEELKSRDKAIVACEDDIIISERAQGRKCMGQSGRSTSQSHAPSPPAQSTPST